MTSQGLAKHTVPLCSFLSFYAPCDVIVSDSNLWKIKEQTQNMLNYIFSAVHFLLYWQICHFPQECKLRWGVREPQEQHQTGKEQTNKQKLCSYLKCVIWFSSRSMRRVLTASNRSFSSTVTVPIPSGLSRQKSEQNVIKTDFHLYETAYK